MYEKNSYMEYCSVCSNHGNKVILGNDNKGRFVETLMENSIDTFHIILFILINRIIYAMK